MASAYTYGMYAGLLVEMNGPPHASAMSFQIANCCFSSRYRNHPAQVVHDLYSPEIENTSGHVRVNIKINGNNMSKIVHIVKLVYVADSTTNSSASAKYLFACCRKYLISFDVIYYTR